MGRKNGLEKEIEWLKKDKYSGDKREVAFSCTKNDFSLCRLDFERDIGRLKKGEPIDYVIGWRDFLGCKIDLSEKPLIPREETEFWVGEVIKELGERCEVAFSCTKNDFSPLPREAAVRSRISRSQIRLRRPLHVLDLFAGSGCIGLAVLKHCPNVQMTFADREEKCVRQIKKNLKLNGLKGKVIQTDLFKPYFAKSNFASLQKSGQKFDIIFANPPYVPSKKSKVQKSVKDWEPKEALWAGANGLLIIKKFIKEAKNHLNPDGKIYLEFGYGQKRAIEALLKQNKYKTWEFRKDQFGRFRLVVIQ